MLENLIERGLNSERSRLYVLDIFRKNVLIRRYPVHKKHNAPSYLLDQLTLTMAYREFGYDAAKSKLFSIALDLECKYPKAAASLLRELEETLTMHRLKIPGLFRKTLCSMNPMESANSACRS